DFHPASAAMAARSLGVELNPISTTCYAAQDGRTKVVCLVSKTYPRPSGARYWYAFRARHAEFLSGSAAAYVALGCGSPEKTVLVPAPVLTAMLPQMRQTEGPAGAYHHVEIFED